MYCGGILWNVLWGLERLTGMLRHPTTEGRLDKVRRKAGLPGVV